MRLEIVQYPDPILQQRSVPIGKVDKDTQKLIDDMFETMYAAQGVGLAAPQIGLNRRLLVIDVTSGERPEARLVLANPEILHVEGEVSQEEGCLSLPGFRAHVRRPKFVTVRAQDVHGMWYEMKGEDMLARAFCHELDHLDGRLFIHHLSFLKRDMIKRKIKKKVKAGEW